MASQPDDVLDRFIPHIVEEFLTARVHGTGKHEILPYQDAVFIAEVVKEVVLIDTASPHAQHVHVGILYIADKRPIGGILHPGQKVVLGDVVGALDKYRHAIDLEIK